MAEHIYQRELTSQASALQQIRTRFRSTKDLHTYLADNCKYESVDFTEPDDAPAECDM